MSARRNIRIDREDIYLLTPDGRRVPLATQGAWSRDHRLVRPIMLQARSSRHAIGSYFKESASRNFRFFVPPFGGTAYHFFNANQWRMSLHTFEYIARRSLNGWWQTSASPDGSRSRATKTTRGR